MLAATNQVPVRHFQIFKEVVSTLELWHEAADSLDRLQVGRGRDTNVVQTIDSRYRLGSLRCVVMRLKKMSQMPVAILVKVNVFGFSFFLPFSTDIADNPDYHLEQPDDRYSIILIHSGLGSPSKSKPNDIKMSPSTQNLLMSLEAQKCIGCCIQRTKVLEDALTYCRIPGWWIQTKKPHNPKDIEHFLPNKQGAFDLVQHGKGKRVLYNYIDLTEHLTVIMRTHQTYIPS